MGKNLLLAIGASMFIFSCNSDDDSSIEETHTPEWIQEAFKTDLEKDNLKGKVKSVKSIVLSDDSQEVYGITTKSYNSQGYVLERVDYNADGVSIFTKESYVYNGDNLIEEKYQYQFNPDAYDKAVYKYSQGRFAESFVVYNEQDKVIAKSKIAVDNANKKVKFINPENNKTKSIVWYNADGDIIKQEAYSTEGVFQGETVYAYDSVGNKTQETSYGKEKQILVDTKTDFVYDQFENIISETVTINDYKNDNNKSFSTNYVYTYDSKKNWIKKVTQVDGGVSATTITKREIEYYQ